MSPTESPRTTNRLLLAIVVFLAGVVLKFSEPVVIALLLTVLLVYLIDPLVVLLMRLRSNLQWGGQLAFSPAPGRTHSDRAGWFHEWQ